MEFIIQQDAKEQGVLLVCLECTKRKSQIGFNYFIKHTLRYGNFV